MEKEEIEKIARMHLREEFPLYEEEHDVIASMSKKGKWCISYETKPNTIVETTRFDMEINENDCFLNYIEIEREQRGKGNGKKLYSVVEHIAIDLGSEKISLTASGTMPDGRTKTEYMESLGYRRVMPIMEKMWRVEKVLKI